MYFLNYGIFGLLIFVLGDPITLFGAFDLSNQLS
tara:strand:+ start:1227 stop:1328 length:102 start_codon:yes stop_codon:yes gene_type:complete